MTIRELQKLGREVCSESVSGELLQTIHLDVDLIILEALANPVINSSGEMIPNYDISWLYARLDDLVPSSKLEKAKSLFVRRSKGEPLAYLTSRKEFFGRNFHVSKDVLIPRPETELLVERGLKSLEGSLLDMPCLVLELGVGSGCVIVSLLLELMKKKGASAEEVCSSDAYKFVGVDVSKSALDIARKNAAIFEVDNFIEYRLGSCFEPVRNLAEGFSSLLIVSNPPYIAKDENLPISVQEFEPEVALRAGMKGLDMIEEVIGGIRVFSLSKKTVLLMEMGYSQRPLVNRILSKEGFEQFDFYQDLAGLERGLELRCS